MTTPDRVTRQVSDEWIAEVIDSGQVPYGNLVSAVDVCMALRDARAELAALRHERDRLREALEDIVLAEAAMYPYRGHTVDGYTARTAKAALAGEPPATESQT